MIHGRGGQALGMPRMMSVKEICIWYVWFIVRVVQHDILLLLTRTPMKKKRRLGPMSIKRPLAAHKIYCEGQMVPLDGGL